MRALLFKLRRNASGPNRSPIPYAGVVALGILVMLIPLTSPSAENLSLATSAVIYGIAATGLGLLWGQNGQVTIAHAVVFGVGAYTATLLADRNGMSFLATLPLSAIAGGVAAGLIALTSLRTRGHYFVILTFAVGEVAVIAAKQLTSFTGGSGGLTLLASEQSVLGLQLGDREDFFVLATVIAFVVLLIVLAITRSRWGVTLRGIRDNPALATSLGANVRLSQLLVFALSGVIAGVAGQLFVYQVTFIDPTLFDSDFSIFLLLMVLLGGRRYLLGPLVGAAVYVFLPSVLSLSPLVGQMVFGALLIGVILIFPEGLLSFRRRANVGQLLDRLPWRRSARTEPSGAPAGQAAEGTSGGR